MGQWRGFAPLTARSDSLPVCRAQKSAAIGVPLATVLFSPEMAGFVVLPLLLYHLSQLVVAAPLANRLRDHPDGDGSSGSTTRN